MRETKCGDGTELPHAGISRILDIVRADAEWFADGCVLTYCERLSHNEMIVAFERNGAEVRFHAYATHVPNAGTFELALSFRGERVVLSGRRPDDLTKAYYPIERFAIIAGGEAKG